MGIYECEVVAYGSIVLETKIRGESAGHIKDIVVNEKFRYKNFIIKMVLKWVKLQLNSSQIKIYRLWVLKQ